LPDIDYSLQDKIIVVAKPSALKKCTAVSARFSLWILI